MDYWSIANTRFSSILECLGAVEHDVSIDLLCSVHK